MRSKVVLTLITAVVTTPVPAQLTRGSISGTVEDTGGASIEAVRITAVNRYTSIRLLTRTNDAGLYRFAAVDPGLYDLEFVKDGFQPLRVEGIDVGAARDIVFHQQLGLAAVASDVTVTGSPTGVELAKAGPTLESRFNRQLIENLPLIGGDHRDLMLLAPVAVRIQPSPSGIRISVNGQRRLSTNYLLDGSDNNEFFLGLPAQPPAREEIAEVHVQTSAYSAEFGRNTSQFSIVTRSGANRFHGEAWDYYGSSALSALSLADKRAGLGSARYTTNFLGAALGGPIIRNRIFFYATAHANLRRDGFNVRTATPIRIPTPAGFEALASVPLGPGQSTESRGAVLNSLSFLPEIHRNIRAYDNLQPVTINGVSIETGSARIPFTNAVNTPTVSLRLDHQLNVKDTLTLRVRGSQQLTPNTGAFATNLNFGDRFSTGQSIRAHNYALSHVHIFGPRWTNEARASHNFVEIDYRLKSAEPNLAVNTFFMLGPHFLAPSRTLTSTTQFQDVVSLFHGRHSWKMGMDVRFLRFFQVLANAQRGAWVFPGLTDFLNNRPVQLRQFLGTPDFATRIPSVYAFVQDDIRLTPGLTLNLGLRYEITSVPFGFFGAANPEVAAVGVPAPVRLDRNNWAPRAGFAWSHSGTVIRGGFGIAYNGLFEHIIDTRSNYPRAQLVITQPPQSYQLFPRFNPSPVINVALADFTNLTANAQHPTTHFYSLSVQRQFGAYIGEIGYSGSRAYHLARRVDANPGILTAEQAQQVIAGAAISPLQLRRRNPSWGVRGIVEPAASSYYNALFLRVDRKLANGLLLGGSFTYSSNLTENDDEPAQLYSCFRCDYARSNFDRPLRGVVHYLYQLPVFTRRAKALQRVAGGWQIAGFSEWQSGQPFNIVTGVDSVGAGVELLPVGAPNLFPVTTARPDRNPTGVYALDPVTSDWRTFTAPRANSGLFVSPRRADGAPLPNSMPQGGNLGRNAFRGPRLWNWNLSLMKTIHLSERLQLNLRGEWVNVFNHRNFGQPVSDMNSLDFGRNLSTPLGRVTQLVAKLRF